MTATEEAPLLTVSGLNVAIEGAAGTVQPVRDVSFTLAQGDSLAIVGESGSGKSMTSLAVLGLLPEQATVRAEDLRFDGAELTGLADPDWQQLRGEQLAMIFQDPLSALNPALTVGYQIAEMFRRHRGWGRSRARQAAVELMAQVGIPDPAARLRDYPHQFSGGMRQRVMIAMALALEPRLLIADEPTTALDVTVQAQILRLLRQRQRDGLALVVISHDLGVVARSARRVVVMYAGTLVESGLVAEVYPAPAHPYTAGLLAASPRARGTAGSVRPIDGQPPDISALPAGCAFHPRCPIARERCTVERPKLRVVAPGRESACHFAEEVLTGEPTKRGTGAAHG
ncbi:oligopeptide transport system ATP-binding protein [Tamaricihabitans halophyticus]|uniref:Oligopeptide transport system ATP-binding protein n=1 Tax=Tamaricihabitans halophyticus TaxID=1262583 RepID=A0A4R2QJN0_9PSEU|nr:ABC transporter ATP-binding protein [Tamaricihabitans halophyticus]TCP47231.1 oligopeptide transport system ATP-binding protein [Tamaricihabitans halophyticus]